MLQWYIFAKVFGFSPDFFLVNFDFFNDEIRSLKDFQKMYSAEKKSRFSTVWVEVIRVSLFSFGLIKRAKQNRLLAKIFWHWFTKITLMEILYMLMVDLRVDLSFSPPEYSY